MFKQKQLISWFLELQYIVLPVLAHKVIHQM